MHQFATVADRQQTDRAVESHQSPRLMTRTSLYWDNKTDPPVAAAVNVVIDDEIYM